MLLPLLKRRLALSSVFFPRHLLQLVRLQQCKYGGIRTTHLLHAIGIACNRKIIYCIRKISLQKMSIKTANIVGASDTITPGTLSLIGHQTPWGKFIGGPLSERDISRLKIRLRMYIIEAAVQAAVASIIPKSGASAEV